VDHWQAFATPTRRPSARGRLNRNFGLPEADQENEGRMTNVERGLRRGRQEGGGALLEGEPEWVTPTP